MVGTSGQVVGYFRSGDGGYLTHLVPSCILKGHGKEEGGGGGIETLFNWSDVRTVKNHCHCASLSYNSLSYNCLLPTVEDMLKINSVINSNDRYKPQNLLDQSPPPLPWPEMEPNVGKRCDEQYPCLTSVLGGPICSMMGSVPMYGRSSKSHSFEKLANPVMSHINKVASGMFGSR